MIGKQLRVIRAKAKAQPKDLQAPLDSRLNKALQVASTGYTESAKASAKAHEFAAWYLASVRCDRVHDATSWDNFPCGDCQEWARGQIRQSVDRIQKETRPAQKNRASQSRRTKQRRARSG